MSKHKRSAKYQEFYEECLSPKSALKAPFVRRRAIELDGLQRRQVMKRTNQEITPQVDEMLRPEGCHGWGFLLMGPGQDVGK
jgi:hypothetical protein